MALSLSSPLPPLTPSEIAQIPSRSLPVGPQLSHLLQEFTTLSLSLLSVLSSTVPSTSATTTAISQIYNSLSVLDEKFVAVLSLASEHQRNQRKLTSVVEELRTVHNSKRSTLALLHDSISSLSPILTSGELDRKAIASSQSAYDHLDPETLLSYSRLLAPFTSAPPSSLFPLEKRESMDPSGRGLPNGAFPPFPTEGVMRRGKLQFGKGVEGEGEEGMVVGETGEVGVRKEKEKVQEKVNPAVRLQQQARQMEQSATDANAGAFSFDLDLNPDL